MARPRSLCLLFGVILGWLCSPERLQYKIRIPPGARLVFDPALGLFGGGTNGNDAPHNFDMETILTTLGECLHGNHFPRYPEPNLDCIYDDFIGNIIINHHMVHYGYKYHTNLRTPQNHDHEGVSPVQANKINSNHALGTTPALTLQIINRSTPGFDLNQRKTFFALGPPSDGSDKLCLNLDDLFSCFCVNGMHMTKSTTFGDSPKLFYRHLCCLYSSDYVLTSALIERFKITPGLTARSSALSGNEPVDLRLRLEMLQPDATDSLYFWMALRVWINRKDAKGCFNCSLTFESCLVGYPCRLLCCHFHDTKAAILGSCFKSCSNIKHSIGTIQRMLSKLQTQATHIRDKVEHVYSDVYSTLTNKSVLVMPSQSCLDMMFDKCDHRTVSLCFSMMVHVGVAGLPKRPDQLACCILKSLRTEQSRKDAKAYLSSSFISDSRLFGYPRSLRCGHHIGKATIFVLYCTGCFKINHFDFALQWMLSTIYSMADPNFSRFEQLRYCQICLYFGYGDKITQSVGPVYAPMVISMFDICQLSEFNAHHAEGILINEPVIVTPSKRGLGMLFDRCDHRKAVVRCLPFMVHDVFSGKSKRPDPMARCILKALRTEPRRKDAKSLLNTSLCSDDCMFGYPWRLRHGHVHETKAILSLWHCSLHSHLIFVFCNSKQTYTEQCLHEVYVFDVYKFVHLSEAPVVSRLFDGLLHLGDQILVTTKIFSDVFGIEILYAHFDPSGGTCCLDVCSYPPLHGGKFFCEHDLRICSTFYSPLESKFGSLCECCVLQSNFILIGAIRHLHIRNHVLNTWHPRVDDRISDLSTPICMKIFNAYNHSADKLFDMLTMLTKIFMIMLIKFSGYSQHEFQAIIRLICFAGNEWQVISGIEGLKQSFSVFLLNSSATCGDGHLLQQGQDRGLHQDRRRLQPRPANHGDQESLNKPAADDSECHTGACKSYGDADKDAYDYIGHENQQGMNTVCKSDAFECGMTSESCNTGFSCCSQLFEGRRPNYIIYACICADITGDHCDPLTCLCKKEACLLQPWRRHSGSKASEKQKQTMFSKVSQDDSDPGCDDVLENLGKINTGAPDRRREHHGRKSRQKLSSFLFSSPQSSQEVSEHLETKHDCIDRQVLNYEPSVFASEHLKCCSFDNAPNACLLYIA